MSRNRSFSSSPDASRPADAPRLSGELCAELEARLLGSGATEVSCEVGGLVRPGLAAVEILAGLQLLARRRGCRLRLRGAERDLRLLLDLVGLSDLADGGADTASA